MDMEVWGCRIAIGVRNSVFKELQKADIIKFYAKFFLRSIDVEVGSPKIHSAFHLEFV